MPLGASPSGQLRRDHALGVQADGVADPDARQRASANLFTQQVFADVEHLRQFLHGEHRRALCDFIYDVHPLNCGAAESGLQRLNYL